MNNTLERLQALRSEMRREKIDAIIFPSSDPHNSEYVSPHWQVRKWISGFTGSAGTAVVTLDDAALWTDSRYFLQAEEELKTHSLTPTLSGRRGRSKPINTLSAETAQPQVSLKECSAGTAQPQVSLKEYSAGTAEPQVSPLRGDLEGSFRLMKSGLPSTPTITEWLLRKMSAANGRVVAVDGMVMNYAEVTALQDALRKIGVSIRTNYDAAKVLWKDRPALPASEIYSISDADAGESVSHKLERIRRVMREQHCDAHIVSDLMSVAWTLNLRGDDVPMTPVFISYLLITLDNATLYINGNLTNEAQQQMNRAGVAVAPYPFTRLGDDIKFPEGRILIDPDTTNYTLYNKVKSSAVPAPSPVIGFKAVKNQAEIAGFRRAMLYDGVAMVRFLRWLKPAVEQGGQTEISVSDKLEQLRRECPHCLDLSFSTICGYNAHGAIVHYSATPESNAALKPEGLLLIDSGGQYDCGTTDITRTIALGSVTDEMRRAYTYVLKANIALATAQFPDGTNGTQIDVIARSKVWQGGYSYLHGTGHGVGWRLSVHEGPHAIRLDWRPAPLHAGMTVTDEPGIYLEGKFGIRTENTMIVSPSVQIENSKLKIESSCTAGDTPLRPEPEAVSSVEAENSHADGGNHNSQSSIFFEQSSQAGRAQNNLQSSIFNLQFIQLEPLTLCPIDTAPIDPSLLTAEEVEWLNAYHTTVRESLSPLLTDPADRQWLEEATKPLPC